MINKIRFTAVSVATMSLLSTIAFAQIGGGMGSGTGAGGMHGSGQPVAGMGTGMMGTNGVGDGMMNDLTVGPDGTVVASASDQFNGRIASPFLLRTVDPGLEESSRALGLGPWRTAAKVGLAQVAAGERPESTSPALLICSR